MCSLCVECLRSLTNIISIQNILKEFIRTKTVCKGSYYLGMHPNAYWYDNTVISFQMQTYSVLIFLN